MAATVTGILLTGNHAGRPSSGLQAGTLYACSTHSLIYQTSDTGSTWGTWATLGETGNAAHLADAADAHDASAVSVLDTAGHFTGTDVEAVLDELQDNIDAIPGTHVTFTIGPYLINDIPGTATTQMLLPFFNTTTAVSLGGNGVEYRIPSACHIIGAILTSDAARTAGTATLQVRVGGVATAFNAGAVVLDGTNTTRVASMVAHASGVAASASSSVGVAIVTSGWTPTTANLNALLIISID